MLAPWVEAAGRFQPTVTFGKVVRAGGDVLESLGPPCGLGDCCVVARHGGEPLLAEVVGFRGSQLLLSPLGSADGIEPGCSVRRAEAIHAPDGERSLGRVVDGLGRPLDGAAALVPSPLPREARLPHVGERVEVHEVFETGVRVVDSLLTCGRGQRVGIFAGAGVGKSTLLSMLMRHASADAVVLALVGERAREVRRFVDHELTAECMRRTLVVATTGGQPAALRVRAAQLAAEVADDLRRTGRHVLLVMDSLTRLAMAQREMGLSAGEAPTAKGYPPSVFSLLPRVVERAGAFRHGSITAFFSVLVEGDDLADPVADAVRGLLDGHVVLSRQLAERGLFPAVDVLRSLSRLMPDLVTAEQVDRARRLREALALQRDTEDLVRVGAYKAGSDARTDAALDLSSRAEAFFRQDADARESMAESLAALAALTGQKGRTQ
jgi:FliI/YscN family ATPase